MGKIKMFEQKKTTKRINIDVTAEEYCQLKEQAVADNRPLTNYCRHVLKGRVRGEANE